MIAGLGAAGLLLNIKPPRDYGPCTGCGNPAKGHLCFKCRTKNASVQAADETGETESASQEVDSATQTQERDAGSPAEPACVSETVA
jgi:hypothetical protein